MRAFLSVSSKINEKNKKTNCRKETDRKDHLTFGQMQPFHKQNSCIKEKN